MMLLHLFKEYLMNLISKNNIKTTLGALTLLLAISGCSKKPFGDETPFMDLGGKEYILGEYLSFSTMEYNHPVLDMEGFFPGERRTSTIFVQTELMYDEASEFTPQVTGAADWEWKNSFLIANFFERNTVKQNLGSTRKELEDQFNKNKGKYLFNSNGGIDTTLNAHMTAVAQDLFLAKYPPTDAFRAEFPSVTDDILEEKWLTKNGNERQVVVFLRNEYYIEQFGTNFPEDVLELYGEDSFVTPQDVDIVSQWLPMEKRQDLTDPQTKKMIIGYIASWKIFEQKAVEMGIDKDGGFQQQKKFFERFEVVRYYLNEILTNKLAVDRSAIDKDIALLSLYARQGDVESPIDSAQYNAIIDDAVKVRTASAILERIHSAEVQANVEFLDEKYQYALDKSSEQLFLEAQDYVSSGNRAMGKTVYTKLTQNYPFSTEGRESYRALARLETDGGSYSDAISAYFDYLLYNDSNDEWCKVLFMIGYTYSEHIKNYDLAALNYKWILKNRPACDLAEDTEFMYLHLGEPMAEVEELRAESERQGRSVN